MALSKETPPTIEELQAQLAAAQEQLAKADETIAAVTEEKQQLAAKADELSSQADDLKTQVGELSAAKGSLEAQVADLQAKPGADKAQAKVKKSMLLVVSATDFSYDIGDGLRATPDVPVKAERYEGNLLDSQMKAGYVVEYKAD